MTFKPCKTCDGTAMVTVTTPLGKETWACADCMDPADLDRPPSEEEVSEGIRDILAAAKVNGVIEEVGQGGLLRVTFSALLPPEIAEQIFDLAKEHQVRRSPDGF